MAINKKALRSLVSTVLLTLTVGSACASCSTLPGGQGTTTDTTTNSPAQQTTTAKTDEEIDMEKINRLRYDGAYSEHTGTLAGTDALGRELPLDVTPDGTGERSVGLFYFLWQGQHGTDGPYDNSVIAAVPGATDSEAAWLAAGGGRVGAHHFWGKPMFGYYTSDDKWVMRKHIQMLTDIGVDYLVFDTTNGYTYADQALKLMALLRVYQRDGYNVPKVAFYTNSASGNTINLIYEQIYKAHPEYSELWFHWDGKPMIIGVSSDSNISAEAREFFRIKESQWPNTGKKADGFPWMEFARLLKSSAVYGKDGRREVLNVSIAQHNSTVTMSATAWYGGNDRTRAWHNGKNDPSEDALLSGSNFAEQWEWALKQNVESIFVTGWNEWVAQRQSATLNAKYPIYFVDCCDPATSRDAEPMEGLFGDNYYMQLAYYIRLYKGTAARVDIGGYRTPASSADFEASTAVFRDYRGDTADRNSRGFGSIEYTDRTGLNDIVEARVLRDAENIYFYVKTAANIRSWDSDGRMTLFLNTGAENAWNGYSYCVNRGAAGKGKCALERFVSSDADGWVWESVCDVECTVQNNEMVLRVPRTAIGLENCPDERLDLISLRFKWADGYRPNDIFSFYKNGDAAPIGRFDYVYSNIK